MYIMYLYISVTCSPKTIKIYSRCQQKVGIPGIPFFLAPRRLFSKVTPVLEMSTFFRCNWDDRPVWGCLRGRMTVEGQDDGGFSWWFNGGLTMKNGDFNGI